MDLKSDAVSRGKVDGIIVDDDEFNPSDIINDENDENDSSEDEILKKFKFEQIVLNKKDK